MPGCAIECMCGAVTHISSEVDPTSLICPICNLHLKNRIKATFPSDSDCLHEYHYEKANEDEQ